MLYRDATVGNFILITRNVFYCFPLKQLNYSAHSCLVLECKPPTKELFGTETVTNTPHATLEDRMPNQDKRILVDTNDKKIEHSRSLKVQHLNNSIPPKPT